MAAGLGKQDALIGGLRAIEPLHRVGKVAEAYGTLIRATGIAARIGEVCELRDPMNDRIVMAEVVGIGRGLTWLTPL